MAAGEIQGVRGERLVQPDDAVGGRSCGQDHGEETLGVALGVARSAAASFEAPAYLAASADLPRHDADRQNDQIG